MTTLYKLFDIEEGRWLDSPEWIIWGKHIGRLVGMGSNIHPENMQNSIDKGVLPVFTMEVHLISETPHSALPANSKLYGKRYVLVDSPDYQLMKNYELAFKALQEERMRKKEYN